MIDNVIEVRGLTKIYGATRAVDAIDLEIRRGEIFGLLGPNGAGKTTTILMLLGLTETNGGTVDVLGFDPVRQPLEVKRRVGYLPDAVGSVQAGERVQAVDHAGPGSDRVPQLVEDDQEPSLRGQPGVGQRVGGLDRTEPIGPHGQ